MVTGLSRNVGIVVMEGEFNQKMEFGESRTSTSQAHQHHSTTSEIFSWVALPPRCAGGREGGEGPSSGHSW